MSIAVQFPLRLAPVRPCAGCFLERHPDTPIKLAELEDGPSHACDLCGEQTRLTLVLWPARD